MEDPVLYFGKALNELWEFMDNGVYPFMAFAAVCFAAIAWLLFRKRKSPPPIPASPQSRAIVGIMLASPGMSSDADAGRTRLILGQDATRYTNAFNSDFSDRGGTV